MKDQNINKDENLEMQFNETYFTKEIKCFQVFIIFIKLS